MIKCGADLVASAIACSSTQEKNNVLYIDFFCGKNRVCFGTCNECLYGLTVCPHMCTKNVCTHMCTKNVCLRAHLRSCFVCVLVCKDNQANQNVRGDQKNSKTIV